MLTIIAKLAIIAKIFMHCSVCNRDNNSKLAITKIAGVYVQSIVCTIETIIAK